MLRHLDRSFRRVLVSAVTLIGIILIAPTSVIARPRPERVGPFRLPTVSGSIFDFHQRLEGKIAVVAFWRLGQPRSVELLKDLQSLQEKFSGDGLVVVAIASGEPDASAVARLGDDLQITFPILLDSDHHAYRDMGVIVTPTSFFVASERIRFVSPGRWSDFGLAATANIEAMLGRISEEKRAALVRKHKNSGAASDHSQSVGGPFYNLARRLLARGEKKAASEQFLQAWNAEPRVAEAGVELALLLLEAGKTGEALAMIRQALELLGDDMRGVGVEGVALMRSGDTTNGKDKLLRAVEHGATEPIFYWELGRHSEASGKPEAALRYYRSGFRMLLDQ